MAFLAQELATTAVWWRIYRRDGVALGFTTHDRDLAFDGLRHRAAPGMIPSAIRQTIDLADEPSDVAGALGHDSLREDDLAAGLFDGARVEIGVVDWASLECARLHTGTLGELGRDGQGFTAQLRSAKAALEIDPVPRSGPMCRARFCGPECALDPRAFTVRANVLVVDLDANRVVTDVAADNRFLLGELRWFDGPQTGIAMRVLDVAATGLLLDRPLAATCAPGLRVELREGCDRTVATCADRFGNAVNFRGEPFLPGTDLLAHTGGMR